jgi:hypothetical protein
MAENRIRIEVDYGNAVARVGELELSFKQLENSAGKARQAIQKSLRDTETSINGTVKALSREKAALIETQSTLARNNEEYRKYQVQIDAVQKQIDRLTDTRRKEEVVLKNSAAGIQQQIALLKEEQANRKLVNVTYLELQVEIDKLEAKYQSLTNTIRTGTLADFDAQIAKLQEEQRTMATSRKEMERYEQQIEQVRIRKYALTGETANVGKATQSFSSSAGAAGSTVTEFGRVIGDLPFGLMGIANNLQQLSQQFVDLQAKSGGTKAALKSVMTTMMGPAGFVVAVNIVTSALVYLTMQKQRANKETNNFNESMLVEGKTLEGLITLYHELNGVSRERVQIIAALAQSDKDLADALEKAGSNEAKRAEIAEEYMKLKLASNQADDKRAKIAEDNEKTLQRQLVSEKELADEQERINEIASSTVRQTEQAALNRRIRENDELKEVLIELADATLEYSDAQKALNDAFKESELSKVKEDFAEFREELRLENFEEGPERIAEQLRVLRQATTEIAQTYGTDSAEFEQVMLNIAKKEKEYRDAVEEQRDEATKKEKERLEELADINKEYTDGLEAQGDESGITRLIQQERDAMEEAKKLGASKEALIKIERFFANERQAVIDEANEKAAENRAKEEEKRKKQEEKDAKESLDKQKKRLEEFLQSQVDAMKRSAEMMSDVFSNFGNLLDELANISDARFQRQIGQLREERDIIRSNDSLTKEEKERQLTELRQRENEFQRERINAEYRMFAVQQTLSMAEMVMKERAAFRERQLMRQKFIEEQKFLQLSIIAEQLKAGAITALDAQTAMTSINITAAKQNANAGMSIGKFMEDLGPWGIAAFALSIGGVIASIVSARRKAQAEIAGLSDAPVSVGGGGGVAAAPAAPSFNVVGASAQNQLAAAIAGQQAEPVRAYVVSSDVTTAQELDRKIVEGASI